ncbi:MAG: proline--tRNA ligase [Candidatus Liptonbacteria bacterium]|nr:proline--tRNA ligase [Candidatus Liptonbacteria bacterium]
MKFSKLLSPTLKESPTEAETESHRLLLRAGFIKQVASGIFAFLPLGLKSLRKIENIIREEHKAIGAQEVLLSVLQPKELWEETGRWSLYGEILFKLKDRKKRDFALGPTHEEPITDIVRSSVKSYRDLPLALYQIQTKFRDELRPRFGLIRTKEFLMKDMYSFHESLNNLEEFYKKATRAYERIFSRLKLTYYSVEAESGQIGGSVNHEFLVPGLSGESEFFICANCGHKANSEKASAGVGKTPSPKKISDLKEVYTPQTNTVEKLADFLKIEPSEIIKTMVYLVDEKPVVVLVRGDYEINEIKVIKSLSAKNLKISSEQEILDIFNSPIGFLGPTNLPEGINLLIDESVETISSGVVGANKKDYHFSGFNPIRDLPHSVIKGDYRIVKDGDLCPICGKLLKKMIGMEVGHVFNLGTKYSKAMKAIFLNKQGEKKECLMGCYGIGVSRSLQAIAEEHHDEYGLSWPISTAPFEAVIIPLDYQDNLQKQTADDLYQKLEQEGIETILDDRETSAGIKFNDADLIGYPIRIIISPKTLKQDSIEIMIRKNRYTSLVPLKNAMSAIKKIKDDLFKELEEKTPALLS